MSRLTDRDRHTICAALRAYQWLQAGGTLSGENHAGDKFSMTLADFEDIATCSGDNAALTEDEVDDLVSERLYT